MESKTEALSVVLERIKNKEILLPDFQRGFKWTDAESQARLAASALAKMPVGSILLLASQASDYAYKLIGCKERKTSADLNVQGEIYALLDGQQRVTVLACAFSNVVFNTVGQASNLVSQKLKRRFFLRIPKYNSNDESAEDLFNAKGLSLPMSDPEKSEPTFLADDVYEIIKVVSFNAGGEDCYNPFAASRHPKSELINYCTSGKEYLIPLFLLDGTNDAWLLQIIKRISENIQLDILEEFDHLDDTEKENYVKNKLSNEILDLVEDISKITERDVFEKELKEQGDKWAADMKSYLMSCLNGIQLNQLILDKHNRARAINIYENLNKGGVPLGTFELIMAKFASVSDEHENYDDKLKANMKKKRTYDGHAYSIFLQNDTDVKAKVEGDEYVATLELECLGKGDDDIVKAYIDAYLNVLSLYSYVPDYDTDKIKVDIIKKNKIMEIPPEDLRDKCEDVCEAIDAALFFFQMRCGIRSIKELNYNLMLVVVSYILLNDEYRNNPRVYDYLEAWYWSGILSGYFNIDQTERAVKCIKELINVFENNDVTWIKELQKDIFNCNYFSEKNFILLDMDDGRGDSPKDFLRGIICQYFLAKTYNGIIDPTKKVNPFCDYLLQKHHVIPLGSLRYPDEKIKSSQEKVEKEDSKRDDRTYFLNSPINFIFITDEENLAISDDKLEDYKSRVTDPTVKTTLCLVGDMSTADEAACRTVLSNRFDQILGVIKSHTDLLLQ